MQQQGLAKGSLQLWIEVNTTTEKKEEKMEQAGICDGEIFSIPFNPSSRADQQPPTPHLGNWVEIAASLVDSTYAELQTVMSIKNRSPDQSPVVKRNSEKPVMCEEKKEISAAGAKTSSTSVGSVTRFLPPGSKRPPTASEVDDDERLVTIVKKARKQNNSQTQGQRRYR